MKYSKIQLLLTLLLVFSLLSQCSDNDHKELSVKITNISPESGSIGTVVVISGKGFSETMENNIVKFNGMRGEVTYATNETLIATVPSGTTTGKVMVRVGNETVMGAVFTITDQKTYYIKFKVNGVQKMYDQNYPHYIFTCGSCACCSIVSGGNINNAQMEICNDEDDMVTAEDIESWQGKKISFTNGFPKGDFNFYDNDTSYFSYFADAQEGSEMNITDVTKVPTGIEASSYRVTGNFKCKVAWSKGPDKDVTDGQFVVFFTAH